MKYDAVLLGHGPAAVSAALYLLRANRTVCLVGMDNSSLLKAEKIENYYGLPEPIAGSELFENGLRQAKALGAEIINDQVLVVDMNEDGGFTAHGKASTYTGKSFLFATGAARVTPRIEGLSALEGHGVSYCAVCDGFFYRGKAVGVLGAGDYALHEATALLPLAQSVTLLTNGEPAPAEIPAGVLVDTRPLAALEGSEFLTAIRFSEGDCLPMDGLFVALGIASAADLAKKLGVQTDGRYIAADKNGQTNFPGVYAAGDCVGGLLQVSQAVAEGALAGVAMIQFLKI